jgi:hypothetical protein
MLAMMTNDTRNSAGSKRQNMKSRFRFKFTPPPPCHLHVENFGPIKSAEVTFGHLTVLVATTFTLNGPKKKIMAAAGLIHKGPKLRILDPRGN